MYKKPAIIANVNGEVASIKKHGQLRYDRAQEIADFCRYVTQNIYNERTGERQDIVDQVLWPVADAWHYGYSCMEIEYRMITQGEYKGKRAYTRFSYRAPQNIRFRLNPYTNEVMDLINYGVPYGYQYYLPVEKFLLYTYQPFRGLPYGKGDGRVNHKHVQIISDNIIQWQAALQKHGGGSIVVKSTNGNALFLQKLYNTVTQMKGGGTYVLPAGVEIEALALPVNVLTPFMDAVQLHASQCALNILGQKLTTSEGTGKGTFALATVHQDTQEFFVQHCRKGLENLVRNQMFSRLVKMNYNEEDMQYVPEFSLGIWNHADTKVVADYVKTLVECGVIHPLEDWIKDRAEIPASMLELPTVESPNGLVLTPQKAQLRDSVSSDGSASASG